MANISLADSCSAVKGLVGRTDSRLQIEIRPHCPVQSSGFPVLPCPRLEPSHREMAITRNKDRRLPETSRDFQRLADRLGGLSASQDWAGLARSQSESVRADLSPGVMSCLGRDWRNNSKAGGSLCLLRHSFLGPAVRTQHNTVLTEILRDERQQDSLPCLAPGSHPPQPTTNTVRRSGNLSCVCSVWLGRHCWVLMFT